MTAEEKNALMAGYTPDEQIGIYSEAVIALYKRLLDYACVTYDENGDYATFLKLVNTVYYNGRDLIGHDLETMRSSGYSEERILSVLEADFKQTALVFKKRYAEVLQYNFENELDAQKRGINILPDARDQHAFENLLEKRGVQVFTQVATLASQGDISAQVLLGKMYFLGWGTKVGQEEGLFWFKKAAESENGVALFYAGMAHEFMTYEETDVHLNARSCEYYRKALRAGYTEAAYALYRYFTRYVSGKTGQIRAKQWLKKGIELGSLYCLYETCEGADPAHHWTLNNTKNIVDLIRAAAHFGMPEAVELMGDLYLQGHAGLSVDYEKAESMMQRACEIKH